MKLINELQSCIGVARFMPRDYIVESRVAHTINMTEVYPNTICHPTIDLLRKLIKREWYKNE